MRNKRPKLLLIGWDGADWRIIRPLLAAGKMPYLQRLLNAGAAGNLSSLPPFLSPMLWNSIATGKRAEKHGVLGFTELDETGDAARPVTSLSRKARPIWDILSCEGWKCHVVDWFASYPAEPMNGYNISEAFFRSTHNKGKFEWNDPAQAVYPPDEQDDFKEMRPKPQEIDLNILRLLIPTLEEFDYNREKNVHQLALRLSELYSVHNCAMSIMDEEEWDFLGVYYHFIDWMGHDFMPYHPPKRPNVSDQDFQRYSEVVTNAYRIQDLLLGETLGQAGPDVNVFIVSDHGFQSDNLRPERTPSITAGIASWHRPYGMFAAVGPDIVQGKQLPTASLLDITPTMLHLAGLPVGEDMDGQVVPNLTTLPADVQYRPTWEGPCYAEQAGVNQPSLTESESTQLMEQFELLGYITKGASKQEEHLLDMTRREMAFNLGISLLDSGKFSDALPHLEIAYRARPEQANLAFHLSRCLYELGLVEESNRYLTVLEDYGETHPSANLIMGQIYAHRGRYADALKRFEFVEKADPGMLGLQRALGMSALALDNADRAQVAFELAIEQDSDDAIAFIGLARAHLKKRDAKAALEAVDKCLELQPYNPAAMVTKGAALALQGKLTDATKSYEAALEVNPEMRIAHQLLAHVKEKIHGPGAEEYWRHWQEAERLMAERQNVLTPEEVQAVRRGYRERQAQAKIDRLGKRAGQEPLDKLELLGPQPGSSGKTFTLVSGLPRSGTSLLMQMLDAGGVKLQTDGKREADEHNPRGYLEWEPAKDLPKNPKLIEQLEDRTAKVVSILLRSLPREHKYRVLFVVRDPAEVAASQSRMRASVDGGGQSLSAEQLAKHQERVMAVCERSPYVDFLPIEHRDMIENPLKVVEAVVAFLGAENVPHVEKMASVVDPKLYRQRKEQRV